MTKPLPKSFVVLIVAMAIAILLMAIRPDTNSNGPRHVVNITRASSPITINIPRSWEKVTINTHNYCVECHGEV